MAPEADDFDGMFNFVGLIDQTVLAVQAAGIGSAQIAYQLFIRRIGGEGIVLQ